MADESDGLEQIQWWNEVHATTDPTRATHYGMAIACAFPYVLYYHILNQPNMPDGGSQEERLDLLLSLQLLPSIVVVIYIMWTGLQRIQHSPAAAHDPADMYAAGLMPAKVYAANRAFINTLEQYVLLLTTSCALALRLPIDQMKMLPALYVTWSVCRVIYMIGYIHFSGSGRMAGFPGTVLPTTAALCYALYLTVKDKGFLY